MLRKLLLLTLIVGSSAFAFDHDYTTYGDLLNRYVADGSVDYNGLMNDRAALDNLLEESSKVSFEEYKTFSRARQMSFMINLYNAATIVLVLDNYPVESIKDLGGMFSSPWNKKFIKLFDRTIGLGHIEHDILRSEFEDPRIHFAIVCASIGCPWLIGEPYLPNKLEEQLSTVERQFMTERPSENDFRDGKLHVSPIFKWFAKDFGGKDGVRRFARKYYSDVNDETRIEYTDYDWNLNIKP